MSRPCHNNPFRDRSRSMGGCSMLQDNKGVAGVDRREPPEGMLRAVGLVPSVRGDKPLGSLRRLREGRSRPPSFPIRSAFTLIEMLVVITIMLILTAITFTVINVSMNADRISDSGRTVQAFMEGARDRAIHAGEPRGVRFILDPTSTTGRPIASSMVYIGAPGLYGDGLVYFNPVADPTVKTLLAVPNSGTGWINLSSRGRLVTGARIQIPKGTGSWYTIALPSNPLTSESFKLTRRFIDTPPPLSTSPATYLLELTPAILPGQQPRPLARGIMIDLSQSPRLPGTWAGGADPRMDIMFSPRGTVTGPLSGFGMIHLVLADVRDVLQGRAVGASTKEGGELILTVTTQTGNISTHHVDIATPGDPFRFAELGEAAK